MAAGGEEGVGVVPGDVEDVVVGEENVVVAPGGEGGVGVAPEGVAANLELEEDVDVVPAGTNTSVPEDVLAQPLEILKCKFYRSLNLHNFPENSINKLKLSN